MDEPVLPDAEDLPIMVRGYIGPPKVSADQKTGPRFAKRRKNTDREPDWSLVFDTETTVDAYQNLRFGTYQLRHRDALFEQGLFYNPATLSEKEIALVTSYAAKRDLRVMSLDEFVRTVFVGKAYQWRAQIIGFNLPFDISRIAARYGSARGKAMNGGFTFQLLDEPYSPYIQIKHLNSRAALIQFAMPKENLTLRSQKKRGEKASAPRGSFIDLKTIAAALFSRSFSLGGLADFLKTPARKMATDEHGVRLTASYLDYAMADTQVTWECFIRLRDEFARHGLKNLRIGKVMSEASLGKGYLKAMGIQPLLAVQQDFPASLLGQILSSYYGGRSEVRLRRVVRNVFYCDFLSMYPTVCTLMNLWRFVIAKGVTWKVTTIETASLLASITPADLQDPQNWRKLHTLVRLRPNAAILPVRARYTGQSHNIGVNHLTSSVGLWFTLADVIASKFLTGKTPVIEEAVSFTPLEVQDGLDPIAIAGNAEYLVDPVQDDFYSRLIDLRSAVKDQIKVAPDDRDSLDATQKALKLLANSTSYGIFVELIASEDADGSRLFYGVDGAGEPLRTSADSKVEDPGPFFHPLLGTLITGAARLMLALAEVRVGVEGLDWAFCDTDSMAIAKPDGMNADEFRQKSQSVCDWFRPLSPYKKKGPLFKVEDANFAIKGDGLEPLFCYCISSKRYVLFNFGEDGSFIIRKASAHGLGHLRPPYGDDDASASIPDPQIPLKDIGVDRWHYDLWMQILAAAHSDRPAEVDLDYHPALNQPAVSRYAATSPKLLRWFKKFNAGEPTEKQVKPFNFLLCFSPKSEIDADGNIPARRGRGRPKKIRKIAPVAPFSKDHVNAAKQAFDRETGKSVDVANLKTNREVIAQYHLHPEIKFLNADFLDKGETRRRHIVVANVIYIGKESNELEEQAFTGAEEEALLVMEPRRPVRK